MRTYRTSQLQFPPVGAMRGVLRLSATARLVRGSSAHIPSSRTTTRPRRAVTSRRGNSLRFSQRNCGRLSNPSASAHSSRWMIPRCRAIVTACVRSLAPSSGASPIWRSWPRRTTGLRIAASGGAKACSYTSRACDSATASGPAGKWSCPLSSFTARHTPAATSCSVVTTVVWANAAKMRCANGA